jgi:serine/threonine-protein kinase
VSFEPSITSPAELAARRIGEVVADKWRLERVLGHGGMATVYAASHKNNLRPAALKLLHPELAANADIKKRFLREGYIANRVGHPNAVAVLDDGVAGDGTVFLVMELLVGESVADRREKGRLNEAETLRVAEGVLDVLAAAHEQGIVHRDLKPDNVFLMKDGAVKVLDFGIARLLEPPSGEQQTQTGVMMGTPAYMPPEQARGRSSQVDGRSDLWSLGAILFACLTGRHVHEAETSNEALLRAMTTPAPELKSVLPDVDPRVAAIVDRALAFEPEQRWPTAQAMQAAVRDVLLSLDPTRVLSAPALAPSSGRVVTAVTKAPIVQDLAVPRSRSGGRALVLLTGLGGLILGVTLVLRVRPMGAAAGFDPSRVPVPVSGLGAPDGATLAATAPPIDDAGVTVSLDATTAAVALEAVDASDDADVTDADVDADDDEYEDDDGGDDEDEVVDAGSPSRPSAHTARQWHAPKKAAPHKKKKRHKKKRR